VIGALGFSFGSTGADILLVAVAVAVPVLAGYQLWAWVARQRDARARERRWLDFDRPKPPPTTRTDWTPEVEPVAIGWYVDPWGIHGERWFSEGRPTGLVRDGRVVHHGQHPPPGEIPGPLIPTSTPGPAGGADLRRADDAQNGAILGDPAREERRRSRSRTFRRF
jgi:hypothetical protein